VDFDAVDYYLEPIPKKKLKELLRKMGVKAAELLRKKEEIYKKLGLAEKNLSEEEILDLMVEHPDLIQRPIVEKGARAILALALRTRLRRVLRAGIRPASFGNPAERGAGAQPRYH